MPTEDLQTAAVSQSAPGDVLRDLIAAGLVSHEMIGDPERLGGETACLQALCELVPGSVWRLDPFHYAFRADPEAAQGALADLEPEPWATALEAALRETLGPDAVWVSALEPAPDPEAALEAQVLHLRAYAAAAAGIAPPEPDLTTVINARFAVETARLAAGETPGSPLDMRLARIEAQVDRIAAILERPPEPVHDPAAAETLVSVLARLETQGAQLAALADAGSMAGFQETVGLALAEFLARLEKNAARSEKNAARSDAREAQTAAAMSALGQ